MPELRRDPVIGRWVIISSERGKRPSDFNEKPTEGSEKYCPFCEGSEHKTPPEVYALREPGSPKDGPGWQLRVVPNKYPALEVEGELIRKGEGMFDKISGIGAHEVLIETPHHFLSLAELPLPVVRSVLETCKVRIGDLAQDIRLRYPMIFKNHGRAAGASLQHSHSQIIVLPIVPKRVQEEINGAQVYYNYKERCIFCDIIRQELEVQKRVICFNDLCIAVAPYAPRFPFETWIMPRNHISHYELSPKEVIASLAAILKEVLLRLKVVLEDPPYNFVVHTLPFGFEKTWFYHWHLEVIPIITRVAGFEWGTGFYINPTPPEHATRYLLEADISAYRGGW